MKKYNNDPLNLYRVKYNIGAGKAAMDSFHYYQALSAEQALSFHNFSMEKQKYICQIISIERKNIYSGEWEDESESLFNNLNET